MKNKPLISLFSLVLLTMLIVVNTGLSHADIIVGSNDYMSGFANTMFADIPLDYENYNAIYYLKNTGVIKGDSTGAGDGAIPSYRPNDTVNRAEFLKIIYEGTDNANHEDYDSCFPDVPANAWYSTYVCQAKADGVVAGYSDGKFKPEQTINQAEALKILSELTNEDKPSPSEELEWYEYYSIPAEQKNIMPVEDIGKQLTRAEIAEMIYRDNQIEVLNVPYYDQQWDNQVFDLADIPLTGALGPGGLLGPGGPMGASGAFTIDGPFANNADGIKLVEEDFYNDNYCYFSDTGDFSGDSLEFLKDFAEEDLDAYLEDNDGDIENFGKMFCYPEEMEDIELVYFSEELRNEYEVVCWEDPNLPRVMNDDSQELLCYAKPPETGDSEFEEPTLDVYVGGFEESAINFDDNMVKVLEFNLGAYTNENTEFYGIKVKNFGEGDGFGVRRFILKDNFDNVLYDRPVYLFDWQDKSMELVFNDAAVITPGAYKWYSLYADFDWEDYNGELLFGFEDDSAILTLDDVAVHLGPDTDGPILSVKEPLVVSEEEDWWPTCALASSVDSSEASGDDSGAAAAPAAPGPVVLGPNAHVVKPIDQQGSTCLSAAVYASLRWLEEKIGEENLINDIIENGQEGYDKLKRLINPRALDPNAKKLGSYGQAKALKKYISDNFPGCLEADFDSTWGGNPTCESIKSYFDNGCDIPLQIWCNEDDSFIEATLQGIDKGFGHGVDVVDVQIDPNNQHKCDITFANSWKAGTGELAGPDTDGFKGGVYHEAEYDDSVYGNENFKVKPRRWWNNHSCSISIANYICVKNVFACGLDTGGYVFPLIPEPGED